MCFSGQISSRPAEGCLSLDCGDSKGDSPQKMPEQFRFLELS